MRLALMLLVLVLVLRSEGRTIFIPNPAIDHNSKFLLIEERFNQNKASSAKLVKRYAMQEPDPDLGSWSTSRTHGWQGSKKSLSKTDSPGAPAMSKPPVEVYLDVEGPVELSMRKNGGRKSSHMVGRGETWRAEHSSQQKISLKAVISEYGKVQCTGMGAKSYMGIMGNECHSDDALESFGPGPRRKKAILKAIEINRPSYVSAYIDPPQANPDPNGFRTKGSVKAASKVGRVATQGIANGTGQKGYKMIKTVVSNSPSHSPPPSPGTLSSSKLHPTFQSPFGAFSNVL